MRRPLPGPLEVFCDNQATISLAKNPMFQRRSKHFDTLYHWLREKILDGTVSVSYTPTSSMQADLLTKSLARVKHESCVDALSMQMRK